MLRMSHLPAKILYKRQPSNEGNATHFTLNTFALLSDVKHM